MTSLNFVIESFGFDPTILAGRPTGYAMLYWVGLSVALAMAATLTFATPLRLARGLRWLCLGGIIAGLLGLTVLNKTLFTEYTGQEVIASDTGIKETYVFPIPMPGLRSSDFDENWYVGSPRERNAKPPVFENKTLEPQNAFATFMTVFLHWAFLVLLVACFFAVTALALKAILHRVIVR